MACQEEREMLVGCFNLVIKHWPISDEVKIEDFRILNCGYVSTDDKMLELINPKTIILEANPWKY